MKWMAQLTRPNLSYVWLFPGFLCSFAHTPEELIAVPEIFRQRRHRDAMNFSMLQRANAEQEGIRDPALLSRIQREAFRSWDANTPQMLSTAERASVVGQSSSSSGTQQIWGPNGLELPLPEFPMRLSDVEIQEDSSEDSQGTPPPRSPRSQGGFL
jgi:hypothetical protein